MTLSSITAPLALGHAGQVFQLLQGSPVSPGRVADRLAHVRIDQHVIRLDSIEPVASSIEDGSEIVHWRQDDIEFTLQTRSRDGSSLLTRILEVRNLRKSSVLIDRITLWSLLLEPAAGRARQRFSGTPAQTPIALSLENAQGGTLAGIANPFFHMSVDPGQVSIWYEPMVRLAPGDSYVSDTGFLATWHSEGISCLKEMAGAEQGIDPEQEILDLGLVKAFERLVRTLTPIVPVRPISKMAQRQSTTLRGLADRCQIESRLVLHPGGAEDSPVHCENMLLIEIDAPGDMDPELSRLDRQGQRLPGRCLAAPANVEILLSRLVGLIERHSPDTIEYRNYEATSGRGWSAPECFDPSHGHEPGRSRYHVWRNVLGLSTTLKERFPGVRQFFGSGWEWLGPWTGPIEQRVYVEEADRARLAMWHARIYGGRTPAAVVMESSRDEKAGCRHAVLSALSQGAQLELPLCGGQPSDELTPCAALLGELLSQPISSSAPWLPLFGQPLAASGGPDGMAWRQGKDWWLFLFNPTMRSVRAEIDLARLSDDAGPASWLVRVFLPERPVNLGHLDGDDLLTLAMEPFSSRLVRLIRSDSPGDAWTTTYDNRRDVWAAFPGQEVIAERLAAHRFYLGDPPEEGGQRLRPWPSDGKGGLRSEFSDQKPGVADLRIVVPHDHLFDEASLLEQAASGVTAKTVIVSVDALIWEDGGVHFPRSIRELEGWAERARREIRLLTERIERHPAHLLLARSAADLDSAESSGRSAVLIGFEGGKPLEGSLERLAEFHELGLRQLQFTWAFRNQIVDAQEEPENGGLTPFGRKVIREINRLGILGDMTHISRQGFFDVLEHSDQPVIASHSSAFAFCPDPGNLTDDQMRALAEAGGVAGVHFCSHIVKAPNCVATMEDVVDHIVYMTDLMGVDHVGLGCDFLPYDDSFRHAQELFMAEIDPRGRERIDLLAFVRGLDRIGQLRRLIPRLRQRGFDDDEIRKLMGGNWLRVYRAVLK